MPNTNTNTNTATAAAQTRSLEVAGRKGEGWTSADLAVLAATEHVLAEAVAQDLGRTLYSVYTTRRNVRLGVARGSDRRAARRAGEWTPAQVARAMSEL